jgi:hypothetical protein
MFRLFSKKVEEKHSDKSESKDENKLESNSEKFEFKDKSKDEIQSDSEDEVNMSLTDIIFNRCLDSNPHYGLYKCDAREICTNIPIWSSNRKLDPEHINSLARDIKNSNYVMGTFKIMRCGDEYRIFDGQHRYFAIREIITGNIRFNVDVYVELFSVESFDSDEALILFSKANNIKNVEVTDTPNFIAHGVCKRLSEIYPKVLVESSVRVNRPRIDKRILYEKLKQILEGLSQDNNNTGNSFPNTVDAIIKSIEAKNISYSLRKRTQFKAKGITDTLYNKAKGLNFYLGLETDIDEWLNTL